MAKKTKSKSSKKFDTSFAFGANASKKNKGGGQKGGKVRKGGGS